jgi:hypothetical protein
MQPRGLGGPPSYAVLWRTGENEICSGALVIEDRTLRLEGTDRQGRFCSVEIAADAVQSVRIGRAAADRIDGRTALVLRLLPNRTLLVASAVGLGMIHEMADRLASAGFVLEPPS